MVRIERFGLRIGFRRRFFRVFLLTLLATALAKGAAFLPGYSIDDYSLVLLDAPSTSMLEQGRFGQAFLVWGLHFLQLEPAYSRIPFVGFSILVSALFGTLVARYWNMEKVWWLPAAIACIVANHPFTAEIFTFRTALGTAIFSLVILCLLLVPARWSPRLLLAGAALFALALSIYQVALHFALMVVLVGAALWLTRVLVLGSALGWPKRVTSLLSPRRLVRHRNTALLACILLGLALYVLLGVVSVLAFDVSLSQRTALVPFDQLDERVQMVREKLEYRLVEPSPLLVQPTKGMLLFVLLSALAGVLWRTRPWLAPRSPLVALSVLGILAVALVWSLGIPLVLQELWLTPRVMAHVGIFWAGALAISSQSWGPRARGVLAPLAFLIVLSFIGSNNRVLEDQLRLNVRDAHKASRIIGRLEALPGFRDIETVAVDGVDWFYPVHFKTQDHDMNISAFGADLAKPAILREMSGYDLKPATEAGVAAAAAYCREVQPWPGPDAVAIRDRVGILCLSQE